ncbi:MAG: class I SAM-dependent methyltransferase [Candidatus Omnitrophica bacterium]|nr:class I SAM-dependent methyltransferase [Candidatus Omnitrophota bacterium]
MYYSSAQNYWKHSCARISEKEHHLLTQYAGSVDKNFWVLDIGDHPSSLTKSPFIPAHWIFMDLSHENLHKFDEKYARIQADAQFLPFLGKKINCIFSRYVLEHLPDIDTFLRESRRVLKKNGTLVAVIPNLYYHLHWTGYMLPFSIQKRLWRALRGVDLNYPICYTANTQSRWNTLAKEYNLEIVYFKYYNAPSAWLLKIPPLFWINELLHQILRIPFLKHFRSSILIAVRFRS